MTVTSTRPAARVRYSATESDIGDRYMIGRRRITRRTCIALAFIAAMVLLAIIGTDLGTVAAIAASIHAAGEVFDGLAIL